MKTFALYKTAVGGENVFTWETKKHRNVSGGGDLSRGTHTHPTPIPHHRQPPITDIPTAADSLCPPSATPNRSAPQPAVAHPANYKSVRTTTPRSRNPGGVRGSGVQTASPVLEWVPAIRCASHSSLVITPRTCRGPAHVYPRREAPHSVT